MINLPLAHLEENGARMQQNAEGFLITVASGASLDLIPAPHDLSVLTGDDPGKMHKCGWAAQIGIKAFVQLDQETIAVTNDRSLSGWGREKKLEAPNERALNFMALALTSVQQHEEQIAALEQKRYGVPPAPGIENNFGCELRENEIRNALRAKPPNEQLALFQELNDGSADPSLILAVLHSPVTFGVLEELAKNGWRKNIDDKDPVGLAQIALEKQSIDWARRALFMIRHRLIKHTGYSREQLFQRINPNLAPVLGFSPDEIARFGRLFKAA